ncbi:hypothetical protein EDD90_5512 [Streptomyces sp. Ag109_O5-1]|uniref:hypothetical protein n=1 Tax=Streptomyces sp. Ag109_O5-1 TaxID=1938851 RepID=UPI000F515AC7|nr:hypothetical protein [Streptomyces sp. Ag109_O5-1]RPE42384.1 hypothetical protein EDD90_5512 [Streptomyces sp. Ag109_O5-1]
MTPRLQFPLDGVRLTPVRLLLVLAAILLPCDTAVAYGPDPQPSDSARASATPAPSRAGTLAGEGRTRPGRPQGPAVKIEGQDPDGDEDGDRDGTDEETATEPAEIGAESPGAASAQPPREADLVPPTQSQQARPAQQAVTHTEDGDTEPVLQILPLGSGLVLIGLGLGLAFIGLRVRRS